MQERAVRTAIGAVLFASIIGLGSTIRLYERWQQPIVVQESDSLADLTTEHPVLIVRYGVYVDLAELASGGTIILPPDHTLDPPSLAAISGLEVIVDEYDPILPAARAAQLPTIAARAGLFEGQRERRGVHTRYVITTAADRARVLRVWHSGATLVIDTDAALRS